MCGPGQNFITFLSSVTDQGRAENRGSHGTLLNRRSGSTEARYRFE